MAFLKNSWSLTCWFSPGCWRSWRVEEWRVQKFREADRNNFLLLSSKPDLMKPSYDQKAIKSTMKKRNTYFNVSVCKAYQHPSLLIHRLALLFFRFVRANCMFCDDSGSSWDVFRKHGKNKKARRGKKAKENKKGKGN